MKAVLFVFLAEACLASAQQFTPTRTNIFPAKSLVSNAKPALVSSNLPSGTIIVTFGKEKARMTYEWRCVNGTNFNVGALRAWSRADTSRFRPLPDWELIQGEVIDVFPEGLLLECKSIHAAGYTISGQALLSNYPGGDDVTTGTIIDAIAIQSGTFEWQHLVRTHRVPAFDFGMPVDSSKPKAAR